MAVAPITMRRGRLPCRRRPAFTLVEILIVVMLLAVLAAIVIALFTDHTADAQKATLQMTVHNVTQRMELEHAITGDWPEQIDPDWFAGGPPVHPQNNLDLEPVEVVDAADQPHPPAKVLKRGLGGAFWYNLRTGLFRARVADQGNEGDTLQFYNEVNSAEETSLGNYSE